MSKKSAKDIAFDKERAKYRKQINDLNNVIKQKNMELDEQRTQILDMSNKCMELQDWIDVLIEYTNIPKEELMLLIEKEKRRRDMKSFLNKNFEVLVPRYLTTPFSLAINDKMFIAMPQNIGKSASKEAFRDVYLKIWGDTK